MFYLTESFEVMSPIPTGNAEVSLKVKSEPVGGAPGMSLHALLVAELKMLGDGREESEEGESESQGGVHHLHYDRRKGWMLRVTVDVGKAVIGKRLKFKLRTRDAGEAERARDLVLATLKRLGLTVRLRMQGRQRGQEGVLRS